VQIIPAGSGGPRQCAEILTFFKKNCQYPHPWNNDICQKYQDFLGNNMTGKAMQILNKNFSFGRFFINANI
jgi:hypothetical protein